VVQVTTQSGQTLHWHKDGQLHHISKKLGDIWVTHFKPHLFEITPDGEFHQAGETPTAMAIASVRLVPSPDAP